MLSLQSHHETYSNCPVQCLLALLLVKSLPAEYYTICHFSIICAGVSVKTRQSRCQLVYYMLDVNTDLSVFLQIVFSQFIESHKNIETFINKVYAV